jgi:hypothetical protein
VHKLKLIFLITLLHYTIIGQGFKRRFKLPLAFNNTSKNIFQTSSGDYLMFGICVDTLDGFLTNRLVVTGLNAQGQPQWTKKYGNSKFEYLDNQFITKWFYKQGNYIYHAGSVRDSNNRYLGVFIKFDLNGDTIWQRRLYDPVEYTNPQMVCGSVDNGFLITGMFQDPNNPVVTTLLIKTDANGNELWRKKIPKNTPNVHDGKVVVQDSLSKKIIIAGYQYIGTSSSYTGYTSILICDSLGTKLSQHNYGGWWAGLLVDLIQTTDKKFVAVGTLVKGTLGNLDTTRSFAVKFDINNPSVPIWSLQFDKPDITNFFSRLIELDNEDLLLCGTLDTMQQQQQATNCLQKIIRVSKNGNILNKKYFDYSLNTSADNNMSILSLNKTSDNGFISAFQIVNTSPNPFYIVKYDSTLCDSSLSYCQAVGMEERLYAKDQFNISPNPTSGLLNIKYRSATDKRLNIKVLNVLGALVYEKDSASEINISGLPAGIYFLNIYSNGRLYHCEKIVKE